jgi:hypothetical protein
MRTQFLLLLLAAVLALAAVPAAVAIPPPEPDFATLIRDINAIGDPGINPQPFLASAMAAERAFMRGNCNAALGALGALENKLDARGAAPPDPEAFRAIRDDIAQIRAALIPPPDPEVPPGPC